MLVFISWSGPRSRVIASGLAEWLPHVIQSVRTFFSPDIEKGTVGIDEIAKNLKEASAGIICLARENLNSSWINFEAGALSKFREDSRVWTLLFDLDHSSVTGPLSQFQHTLCLETEVFQLVKSINSKTAGSIDDGRLKSAFDKHWPDLKRAFDAANEMPIVLEKSDREIMEEVLRSVRETRQGLMDVDEARILSQLTNRVNIGGTPDDVNRRYRT